MKRLLLSVLVAGLSAASSFSAPLKAYPYRGAASADATGRILFADRANEPARMASVTKLMTALIVLEDVRAKRYGFFDRVTATPEVRFSEASWVGLKAGDVMTVRDLMMALMIDSANDAAVALAVHSAGSFENFVARMNARARELGMSATKYFNPNGLPPGRRYPWKAFNETTAADQVKLAVQLLKYPEILSFSSVKAADLVRTPTGYRVAVTLSVNRAPMEVKFGPGESLVKHLKNHNNVMVKDKLKVRDETGREVVDGLKTGYIDAGGSSIVLTGARKGRRVIVVVLGSDGQLDGKGRVLKMSSKVRDEKARKLLTDALDSTAW